MKKLFIGIFICILALAGCKIDGGKKPPAATTGDLELTISAPGSWAVSYFAVEHTAPDSTSTDTTETDTVLNMTDLEPGLHEFDIEAFGTGDVFLGDGSGAVTITAGNTATLTVALEEYVPSTGTVDIAFSKPAGWTVSYYEVEDVRPDSIIDTMTLTGNSILDDLMAGEHTFNVKAYDATDTVMGLGSGTAVVVAATSVPLIVDVDLNFTKYCHPDDYDGFIYGGSTVNMLDDANGTGPATWTYTENYYVGFDGQCLWGMSAADLDADHHFGFGIDTFIPDNGEYSAIDEPGETLLFDAAASDLPNGLLVFTGYEVMPDTNLGDRNIDTRLTVQVMDLSDTPIALEDPADYNLDPAYGGVFRITGDFKIEIILEASYDSWNTSAKAGQMFEDASTLPDPVNPGDSQCQYIIDIGSAIFVMD